jgi:hypothetical protein
LSSHLARDGYLSKPVCEVHQQLITKHGSANLTTST